MKVWVFTVQFIEGDSDNIVAVGAAATKEKCEEAALAAVNDDFFGREEDRDGDDELFTSLDQNDPDETLLIVSITETELLA